MALYTIYYCKKCYSKDIRIDPETRLPYCKHCDSFEIDYVDVW